MKELNCNVHTCFSKLEKLPDNQISEFLAVVIQLISLKNNSKKKKKFQKLLSESMCDEVPFDFETLPFFHNNSEEFLFRSYKNLELYLLLSEKVCFLEKHGAHPDTYVDHLFKIYGPYGFKVSL